MAKDAKKITFLLVGETGDDKSATGNSILGDTFFCADDSYLSVTKLVSLHSCEIDGYHLSVVDTPGFADTNLSTNDGKKESLCNIRKAMSLCPQDSTLTIIIVLRYGNRLTPERKTVLQNLKQIFGDEIFKSCIIVMTFGNKFKEGEDKFQEWTKKQKGRLKELFTDVQFRIVLFDNFCDEPNKRKYQRLQLIEKTDELDQAYTREIFQTATKEQNRFELDAELTNIQNNCYLKLDEFETKFKEISQISHCINKFEDLVNSIKRYLIEVKEKDDPDKIWYKKDESRLLLNEIKSFEGLLNRVQVAKYGREIDNLTNEMILTANKTGQDSDKQDISHIITRYKDICDIVERDSNLSSLKEKLTVLSREIELFNLNIKRLEAIEELKPKIEQLQDNVNKLILPVAEKTLTEIEDFAKALSTEIFLKNGELGKMDEILSDIDIFMIKIKALKNDNVIAKNSQKWNKVINAASVISIPLFSVSYAGVPLSIALNLIPTCAKNLHIRMQTKKLRDMELEKRLDMKNKNTAVSLNTSALVYILGSFELHVYRFDS